MADADSRCAVSAHSVLAHPKESLRPSQESSAPGQAPSHLSQAMSSPRSPWGQGAAPSPGVLAGGLVWSFGQQEPHVPMWQPQLLGWAQLGSPQAP